MRKKTIAIFYIIGLVIVIVGSVLYGIGIAGAVSAAGNAATSAAAANAVAGSASSLALAGIVLTIGFIISAVAWIGSLIAVARQGRWGWFVCIFLFSYIAELVYLIAGPAIG